MGMELRVLGSSSSGNCYILDNGNEALIIEAGIRFIDVKKALDFNIRKVVGCLITHQHNDHAKYAKAMVDCGFHVLALPEVIESKELKGSRVKAIKIGSGYLLGAFICGFCVCMLNTVVNPMLNLLGGGGNKGNQLIQTGGALNSLSGTLTPLFVGALIGTVTSSTAMSDVAPLLFVAMGVFVAAFIVISFVAIPEPHLQKGGVKKEKFSHSPWSFRHTLLGVIGIFIYVGIEIGIPGTLNFYLADSSDKGAGIMMNGAAIGGAIAAIYWLLMLVGRTASSAISGKVSSRAQLIVVSATAIIFVLIAIFTPKDVTVSMPGYTVGEGFMMAQVPVSALFLVLCGLCTSVMWGGIFNLAVEGLGKYTAQASGIFMMMVVGGGVLPLIQQSISDSVGYMASYWLIIAALAYLLFYGLVGCKNVNKDIPVE